MKYLLLMILIVSCTTFTTSKHRCDNKVGLDKEVCIEHYNNYVKHRDYMKFRGNRNHYL